MSKDGWRGRKWWVGRTLAPFSNSPTSMSGKSARASSECPTSSKASVASLPLAGRVNSCEVNYETAAHQLQKESLHRLQGATGRVRRI